jgi:hypothetical protein
MSRTGHKMDTLIDFIKIDIHKKGSRRKRYFVDGYQGSLETNNQHRLIEYILRELVKIDEMKEAMRIFKKKRRLWNKKNNR